jgi:hypothetical protein
MTALEIPVKQTGWIIAAALVALAVVGCGKHQSAKAAAEQLETSFEKTDASLKQEVVRAGTALQTSNYTQAILIMDRVVQVQPMDAAQKKAVDALIIQARQAAQRDPKLNTPELYKATSALMVRVHGEN